MINKKQQELKELKSRKRNFDQVKAPGGGKVHILEQQEDMRVVKLKKLRQLKGQIAVVSE